MVDPQDLRVQEQSKANRARGGKENQLKRKMAGNNLLHFIARAQPHIQYRSWNKPNQDSTKKKTQNNNNNKISNQSQKKHSEVTQREASQDCSDVTDQCSNKKKNKKKGGKH